MDLPTAYEGLNTRPSAKVKEREPVRRRGVAQTRVAKNTMDIPGLIDALPSVLKISPGHSIPDETPIVVNGIPSTPSAILAERELRLSPTRDLAINPAPPRQEFAVSLVLMDEMSPVTKPVNILPEREPSPVTPPKSVPVSTLREVAKIDLSPPRSNLQRAAAISAALHPPSIDRISPRVQVTQSLPRLESSPQFRPPLPTVPANTSQPLSVMGVPSTPTIVPPPTVPATSRIVPNIPPPTDIVSPVRPASVPSVTPVAMHASIGNSTSGQVRASASEQPTTSTQPPPRTAPPAPSFFGTFPQPGAPTVNADGTRQRPDYANMTPGQQEYMRHLFNMKFDTIRQANPGMNITNPPTTLPLDQVHDIYEGYVKRIMVEMNSNQWKVYLVIFFLAIEVFGVKILGLQFSGYTMSQMKIMNRYETMLVELGEQYYVQGGSNWPVEARILMLALFNAVIFVFVKYLSQWLGGEAMAGTIQSVIDSILLGPNNAAPAPVTPPDPTGVPTPAQPAPPPAAPASAPTGGGIMEMLGGLFGGNSGGGQADLLANLGTMFTRNIQTNNSAPNPAPVSRRRVPVWSE